MTKRINIRWKIDLKPEQQEFCKRFVRTAIESRELIKDIVREHHIRARELQIGLHEDVDTWDVILQADDKIYLLYSYDKTQQEIDDNIQYDEPENALDKEVKDLEDFLADKGVYV